MVLGWRRSDWRSDPRCRRRLEDGIAVSRFESIELPTRGFSGAFISWNSVSCTITCGEAQLPTPLNDTEARVIGCLIEKSIVTPDQYPLTLNALTNACDQKSSRDPIMSLTPGEVQHAIREL
jgi:hypothetical protein